MNGAPKSEYIRQRFGLAITCPEGHSGNFELLETTNFIWKLYAIEGTEMTFDGTWRVGDGQGDDRLRCLECDNEFPIPSGITVHFNP